MVRKLGVEKKKKKKETLRDDTDPRTPAQRQARHDVRTKGKPPATALDAGDPRKSGFRSFVPPDTKPFISKEEDPELFARLSKDPRPEFPGSLGALGRSNLDIHTIKRFIEFMETQDEAPTDVTPTQAQTKTKTGLAGFLQSLPGGRSDQEIAEGLKAIEERGEFRTQDLPAAALDAALLGGGGEFVGQGLGVGARAITGGRLAGKAAKGLAPEITKLTPTRKTAITNILKGTKRTGNVVDDAINRELSAVKLAQVARLGRGKTGVDAAVRMINTYNSWSKSRIMSFLAKKPVKTALKIGGAVAGTDVILTWFALDNVSSGMPFLVPTVEESMAQGIMSPEEALATFEDAEVAYDLALRKSNLSAIVNPLLWPSSKLITQGAKIKRVEYELRKANFLAKFGL